EEYGATGDHKEAVRRSTLRMAPVMLTAGLVASASFASLVTFHLKTFQAFGLLTAFGIVSAVILELSFIPAVRVVIKPGAPPVKAKSLSSTDRSLSALGGFVLSGRNTIIAIGIVFIVISSAGASLVHVNNSLKGQFFEKTELRQSDQAINAAFGGTSTFYILVDGNSPDRLKDPAVMAGIEGLQKKLESVSGVGKTQSYVDYLKKMNSSLHAGDPAWEKIPETRQAAAEYLLLYTMSGNPADFNRLVDYNYQKAVVWVFLKSDSTALAEQLIQVVNDYKKSGHFASDLTVGVAGSSPVTVALNETMVEGKKYNILQISALTFVISSLVFRSFLGGLLVVIPLLLSVLINFGFMGFSGLALGIGTATISAMSVGIGADYAIYFLFRFREEYQKSGEVDLALRTTMTTAGKSILFVALAISAGCATLIFPGYYLHTEGILVPLAMLTSSVGAITLLPALTAWLRPKFVFGGKVKSGSK
ncbi:MAG TPA: MMPL family transporter, partial [Nitrospiria bacterium]|nr:MMPL family transporter [Nitrospiria bacterium]